MRDSPAVSVVIPAYNKGSTICSAIESVLKQTFQDFEIIVVDDGSTDDTKEKALGKRVRFFQQERKGVSAARNRGIQESRGEFISFLDGDDLWLPEKLEKQLAYLQRSPLSCAVQCSVYLVDDQLNVLSTRSCSPDQDTLLDFLLFKNLPGLGSTLLVRRDTIERLGGFGTDLVILEDWDVACRLARMKALISMPDFLVLYRQHLGNRSRQVEIHEEPGFLSLNRLFADSTLDSSIRREEARIWARFYAMLAGGYWQNGQWREGLGWMLRALRTSPRVSRYLAGMPLRWLQRTLTARQKISFANQFPFARIPSPAV